MFQRSKTGLSVSGTINLETRRAAQEAATRDGKVNFSYVLRYQSGDNFHVTRGDDESTSVDEVRNRAMEACAREGGKECKFNFAPSGGCIAVARPPVNEFLVSRVHADEKAAQDDAMALCAAEHSDGCTMAHSECAAALAFWQ